MKKIYLLLFALFIGFVSRSQSIYSDNTWRATNILYTGWQLPSFNDSGWGFSSAPNPGTGSYNCKDHGLMDPNIIPMWSPTQTQYAYLRKTFTIADVSTLCSDTISAGADDDIDVYVNGTLVFSDVNGFAGPTISKDVVPYLVNGTNVIAVRGNNTGGFCRVCLVFNTPGGGAFSINAGADISLCADDSAQLNVTGVPGGGIISWTPDSGLSCADCAHPFVKPAASTTYIVTVNNGSCMGRDTIMVDVSPVVVPTVSPQDTMVCYGNTVQLQAGGGTSYLWSPSAGLSDSTVANPLATPSSTTLYTVTVSAGSCPGSTATGTITVAPSPPVPDITQSLDTLFCSMDTSYASFQWYADTALIPGATGPVLVIAKSGNYNIQVTNGFGCSVAVGINVVLTGELPLSAGSGPELFPNPATKHLVISGRDPEIKIFNMLGEYMTTTYFDLHLPGPGVVADISSFPAGMYFVQVVVGKERYCRRFVKE